MCAKDCLCQKVSLFGYGTEVSPSKNRSLVTFCLNIEDRQAKIKVTRYSGLHTYKLSP